MEKVVYLVRERADRSGASLRDQLLEEVAPALQAAGGHDITVHVTDDRVGIAGPMPDPAGSLALRAAVSVWFAAHDLRGDRSGGPAAVDSAVAAAGVRTDGYLVTESVWSDFGQRRGDPRDWPAGDRSPGLVTVALVHRNPRLEPRTFRELWYGHQSPMSEAVQPRMRYVRNTVVHPITPGAPPVDGIVVESWGSEEVVSDIEAFHNGDLQNLTVMLDSVSTAFDMDQLRSIAMSEYLLH